MNEQNDKQDPIEGRAFPTPAQAKVQEAREQKIALVIIGGIGLFLVTRAGVRSAMKPLMKEMRTLGENAAYNSQVTYDNVQATLHNGDVILNAIKKAQPAIDAINAVQGR